MHGLDHSSPAARHLASFPDSRRGENNSFGTIEKQYRDFSNTMTIFEIKQPDETMFSMGDELSNQYSVLSDRDVRVSRELKWVIMRYFDPETNKSGHDIELRKDRLVIETTNHADTVHVKKAKGGGLEVVVNDKTYYIDSQQREQKIPEIHIKTLGGDDRVWVDPDVSQQMLIETGDGADHVHAGAGKTRVFAGDGNDTVRLGTGTGYAEGGEGDDVLIGGSAMSAMYGNNGNDKMFAGYLGNTQRTYMDGGRGDDQMFAMSGHTIMHGGMGENLVMSYGNSHIYTGKDKNRVISLSDTDTVYAKKEDAVQRTSGSRLVEVRYADVGREGLTVTGSSAFRQRVEDDLELLRLSPFGQEMLTELDAAFRRNTTPKDDPNEVETVKEKNKRQPEVQIVKINEREHDGGEFFSRELEYNPSFIGSADNTFPIGVLYHELAHAYNWTNKSKLPGGTKLNDGAKGTESNMERQAVGLWTNESFDFDRDPSTPPTSTNPKPFTENGLREEMGEPLRKAYHIENVV